MIANSTLITDYDPVWVTQFHDLRLALLNGMPSIEVQIEHVGSTAVTDLAAKPIIDIDIIYFQEEAWSNILNALIDMNYFHAGDQGLANREVFKREPSANHPVLDQVNHHLYVCPSNSKELRRHLLFRDHLRTHGQARKTYAALKRLIAEKAGQDRKIYAQLKETMASDFIEAVLTNSEPIDPDYGN